MPNHLEKFDHLIVVMFENRSFDCLAGYLYQDASPTRFIPDDDATPFEGVAGRALSNPDFNGVEIPVAPAPHDTQEDMSHPSPDPGEEYPHINRQLYGSETVPADIRALPDPAPMKGFVQDYIQSLKTTEGWEDIKDPDFDQYKIIMNCFPPQATPVFSGLARQYAISDRWFCSVPSQTFCNRSFFHSGSSHGFVTNADYVKWLENDQPTIFNRLSDRGLDWRVYWDEQDIFGSLTRMIHPTLYHGRFDDHFRHFGTFEQDCRNGDLPPYTFIEPRLFFNHNDMHPPVYLNPLVDSSILAGEILLDRIYRAVRTGKCWERTLLVVTFDEHGGCYDHVSPPLGATPPQAAPAYPLQDGFGFDRFGVRVPAVFISPYVEAGTVVRSATSQPFDHTSMIRTICKRWGLEGLSDRDKNPETPTIEAVLSRDIPRTDDPEFKPRPYVPQPETAAEHSPLTRLQKDILGLATARLGRKPPECRSIAEALRVLKDL